MYNMTSLIDFTRTIAITVITFTAHKLVPPKVNRILRNGAVTDWFVTKSLVGVYPRAFVLARRNSFSAEYERTGVGFQRHSGCKVKFQIPWLTSARIVFKLLLKKKM